MTDPTRRSRIRRTTRLRLAAAAVTGLLAGTARAVTEWVLGAIGT
jgi:hypothetical protein